MSFFGKLKQRLFTSSSRLDKGLDDIVAQGGEAEAQEADAQEFAGQEAAIIRGTDPVTPPTPEPEPTPEPDPTPAPEPEDVPEPEAVPEPEDVPEPDAPDGPDEPDAPEEPQEPDDLPEDIPQEIPDDQPDEMPRDWPQEVPQPQGDSLPGPAPMEIPLGTPSEIPTNPASAKPGLLGRLLGRSAAKAPAKEADPAVPAAVPAAPAVAPLSGTVMRRVLDDAMLEQLEELLIASDMGVDTALRVTANLAEGRYGRKLSVIDIKRALADEIARIMEPVARPMPIYTKTPQVVLVVGVNGSGKTTTIGKLASQFRAAGKSVIIAAGDTFRAAAVEQLQVWGDRAGVPVLTAPEGSDPASLAFDAMTRAEAEGADLLLIDTAGRLQNRADLMEELSKIVRVIRKKDPSAPHNTLLVLDATTGQNALSQVEIFRKLADVSGLVMTKLDGTAKGGVLVALADKFGLPIHAIGVGEQIDDLDAFDPEEFARALTGLDR
ncbi:MAG: signal recognition particle-docking protein FtsY [Rhodobacterales bacterium]